MKIRMERKYVRRRNIIRNLTGFNVIMFLMWSIGIAGNVEIDNAITDFHMIIFIVLLVAAAIGCKVCQEAKLLEWEE